MAVAYPILYSFRRCPYAMRARLALLASGQNCILREVKLSAKPGALLLASPKGTVPVLVLPDGRVIDQSLDIMTWALIQNDPDNMMAGNDREGQALIARNDDTFKHHLDRYKYPDRHTVDPLPHREAALDIIKSLEERLSRQVFLNAPHLTLPDIAIMPFIRQFAAVDESWFMAQPLDGVHTWLTTLKQSAGFQTAMVRYSVWQDGDAPMIFPPE